MPSSSSILTSQYDDYVASRQDDHREAIWYVELSDGTTVYQDDFRPGLNPWSAWLRLGTHCRESGLRIRSLSLRFRSHVEDHILPRDADGYYFAKSAVRLLEGGDTAHFYLVGDLKSDDLKVYRWAVPELVPAGEVEREIKWAIDKGHLIVNS